MKRKRAETNKSISFKRAFVLVVAFHVVIAGIVMAIGGIRSKIKKEQASRQEMRLQDRLFLSNASKSEWPEIKGKPKIVALSPQRKAEAKPKSTPAQSSLFGLSSRIIIPLKPSSRPQSTGFVLPTKPNIITQQAPKPSPKPSPKPPQQPSSKRTLIAKETKENLKQKITEDLQSKWKQLTKTRNNTSSQRETTAQRTYVLSSGDNLYMVSKKLNVPFSELVEVNNIKDVRDLYAGLALKIPQ